MPKTYTTETAPLAPALAEVAAHLLANPADDRDGTPYSVYVYVGSAARREEKWMIVERDGYAATVTMSQDRHTLEVHFPIKPSREQGSAMGVWDDADGSWNRARGMGDVYDAVRVATGPEWYNDVNRVTMPNDGMGHFSWAKLAPVIATEGVQA